MTGVGNLRPTWHFTWPAILYCHLARDLFSMIDMYQQTADMILISWRRPFFWSLPLIRPKQDLNFWRRPFFFSPLEWWRPAGTLLGLDVAH